MGNFDTVDAITTNLREVLVGLGIDFSQSLNDEPGSVPAGRVPFGAVHYSGESFEHHHGQRPGYGEASFAVTVVLRERSAEDAARAQQRWAHSLRDTLTVDALNTGALSQAKPVSAVWVDSVKTDADNPLTFVTVGVTARYRES